jgi:TonB family protein
MKEERVPGYEPDENGAGLDELASPDSEVDDLSLLLWKWQAPVPSASLNGRMMSAYRAEFKDELVEESLISDSSEVSGSSLVKETRMKTCPTCREDFADKFSFCPVDGTPLNELAAAIVATPPVVDSVDETVEVASSVYDNVEVSSNLHTNVSSNGHNIHAVNNGNDDEPEYHLTIIEDKGLVGRLADELKSVAHESELTWPEFKRDPAGFTKRMAAGYSQMTVRFFRAPNVAVAISSALCVMLAVIVGVILLDRLQKRRAEQMAQNAVNEELVLEQMIPNDEPEETKKDSAVGTGKEGRVGFNKGKGEGSKPEFKKASGGGGGGQQETLPPQQGKLPPPSPIPAAIPTLPPTKPVLLPTAGIDIDPALYKDLPYDRYGDPTSKSTATSAGSGTGNGIGTGSGTGIGVGEGAGVGPGRGGNMGGGDKGLGGGGAGGGTGTDYSKTFVGKDVTVKAKILSKPEPGYTEEARKNQVTGTVMIKAVLSASGQVTNIRAVSSLPYGLTEKAIAAARLIKFTPASKDGHTVSQWIQIEYNFNLY